MAATQGNDRNGSSRMKIHVYRATAQGRRYQAYTRDKAGKALNGRVSFRVGGQETVFKRSDWKYIKLISIDFRSPSESTRAIWRQLQLNGAAIAEIRKFPHVIYVYDIQFDTADARVYSLDENLDRFKARHKEIELSPMGGSLGFDEVKFIGKIEDRFSFDLEEEGINLSQLSGSGYFLALVLEVGTLEYLRRTAQRTARRVASLEAARMGIIVEDIRIYSVTYKEKDSDLDPEKPPSTPAISIQNNPVIDISTRSESSLTAKSRAKVSIVVGIGLLGAVLTILAYFELDFDRMRAAITYLLKGIQG